MWDLRKACMRICGGNKNRSMFQLLEIELEEKKEGLQRNTSLARLNGEKCKNRLQGRL